MFIDNIKIFLITLFRRRIFWVIYFLGFGTLTVLAGVISNYSDYTPNIISTYNVKEAFYRSAMFNDFFLALLPILITIIICKYVSDFYENRFYMNELQQFGVRLARNAAEIIGFMVTQALALSVMHILNYLFCRVRGGSFIYRDFKTMSASFFAVYIHLLLDTTLPAFLFAKLIKKMAYSFIVSSTYHFTRQVLTSYTLKRMGKMFYVPSFYKFFTVDTVDFTNNRFPYYIKVYPEVGIHAKLLMLSLIVRLTFVIVFIVIITMRKEDV